MFTTLLDKYTVQTSKIIRTKDKIEQCMIQVEKSGTQIVKPFLVSIGDNRKAIVCKCPQCKTEFNYSLHKFVKKDSYLCPKCNQKNSQNTQLIISLNEKKNESNLAQISKKMKELGISILEKCQGNARKISWKCQCSNGHQFDATPHSLKTNVNPCPHCHYDSHEEHLYRILLETVTGKTFEKVRPDWLKNPSSGKNMELDMFNEELGIAFEYNGIHHYKPIFGEDKLKNVQSKDKLCMKLCKKKGVKLFSVKYLSEKSHSDVEFIELAKKDLEEKGFIVTKSMCNQSLKKARKTNSSRSSNTLQNLKEKLEIINREYVSGTYGNGRSILQVRCKCCGTEKGMRATDIYSYVKHQYGCSVCLAQNKKRA